jgi:hypothetical protein
VLGDGEEVEPVVDDHTCGTGAEGEDEALVEATHHVLMRLGAKTSVCILQQTEFSF